MPIYYIHVGGLHPLITNDHLYFNECQQLIDNLGVGSKVKIVPEFIQDDELAVYMNSADAIVTLEDNNSNLSASGIMHTVAPGKPVIASDVENFDDFPEGTFYKVNLEEKLSPALKEVLTNPELSGNSQLTC